MTTQDDENPFNELKVAQDWISSIESEKSRVRHGDTYPLLNAWIEQARASDILEIGAGQGICSDNIDLEGRRYTGLEPSPHLVARANERYPQKNRRFVSGSAYALPFPDGAFDAAFSVAVWHLLDDIQKASRELARVLKAQGHFMIITANPGAYDLWKAPYPESRSEGRRFEGKVVLPDQSVSRDILYLHTLEEILSALQAAGLEVRETSTFRQFIAIQGVVRPISVD